MHTRLFGSVVAEIPGQCLVPLTLEDKFCGGKISRLCNQFAYNGNEEGVNYKIQEKFSLFLLTSLCSKHKMENRFLGVSTKFWCTQNRRICIEYVNNAGSVGIYRLRVELGDRER